MCMCFVKGLFVKGMISRPILSVWSDHIMFGVAIYLFINIHSEFEENKILANRIEVYK